MIIAALFLNGCSTARLTDMEPITGNFKGGFEIADSELAGTLTVSGDGSVYMEFTVPDVLNGTSLFVDENSVTVGTLGISKQFDKDSVPESSAALYIYSLLKSADGLGPEKSGAEITVSGICDCGKFVIYFDGSGYPAAMELTDIGKKIYLKDVVITN